MSLKDVMNNGYNIKNINYKYVSNNTFLANNKTTSKKTSSNETTNNKSSDKTSSSTSNTPIDLDTTNLWGEETQEIENNIVNPDPYADSGAAYGDYDVGYYNSIAQAATPSDVKKVLDAVKQIPASRRETPLDYTEYIQFEHRMKANGDIMRIGDVQIIIPPSFITVIDNSKHDEIGIIRKKGTMNITRGFNKRYINIVFYLCGLEQINGYEVEGPDGIQYIDGLRPLIAQFNVCPFVPVVNELLNTKFGIFNVALSGLNVSTVQGYKNVFEVNMTMNEITLQPYTELPDCLFHDIIDWDLFRYQYQRQLIKGKTHSYLELYCDKNAPTNSLAYNIYTMDEKILSGDIEATTIFNDDNFNLQLSSLTSELYLTDINFTVSNIVPEIQMSGYSTPTTQFMGGSDYTFTLNFECVDEYCIKQIYDIKDYVEHLAKTYKDFGTFGFIKIENPFINLTGCKYMIIDNIKVASMEGYPNAYYVSIVCTSFDYTQKEREDINGIRPFKNNRKGTQKDAIYQNNFGTLNKIAQDNVIERKMMDIEMYPDLMLPTYEEIDEYIVKLRKFREEKGLSQVPYTNYPKSFSINPGEVLTSKGVYSKYLDPDYYVFYPATYGGIDDNVINELNCLSGNIEPVSTTVKKYKTTTGEYEVSSDSSVDLSQYTKGRKITVTSYRGSDGGKDVQIEYTDNIFANLCLSRAANKCGYVWGATGEILMQGTLSSFKSIPGGSNYDLAWSKWANRQVFDCSGLVAWAMRQLGIVPAGWREATQTLMDDTTNFDTVSKNDLKPGDLCVKRTHVAIYIGNDTVVEAWATKYGVVINSLGSRFTTYKRIKADLSKINTQSSSNTTIDGDVPDYCSYENLSAHLSGMLSDKVNYVIKKCLEKKINPALFVAIHRLETWNGQDKRAVSANNPGGLMSANGLIQYSTKEDGIDAMAETMHNFYYDRGLTDIVSFGKAYCVPSSPWITQVKAIYKEITGTSDVQIAMNGSINDISIDTAIDTGIIVSNTVVKFSTKRFGMPICSISPIQAFFTDTNNKNHLNTFMKIINNEKPNLTEDESRTILSFFSSINETNYDKYKEYQEKFRSSYRNPIKSMYSDMFLYNHTGKLTKAFPSVLFLFEDEGGDWLDGRKLWSNFYLYKSIMEVSIHQERSQPVHTATITLSNIHSNLNTKIKHNDYYNIKDDKEYTKFSRWIYEKTGSLLGTPKLTTDMINVKNQLYSQVNITTGLNVHIRMGFGSNPIMYPITFNGCVTDISTSEQVNIVAQSYSLELINQILSANEKKNNDWNTLGSEPSDCIANILTLKRSEFLNSISSNDLTAKWGEGNKFGIEHFGNSQANDLKDMFDGFFNDLNDNSLEYDKLKNIYLGKYNEDPYCYSDDFFDGEDNANFYLYNKTPWDAFQLLTQTLPEFVCQPIYHQFECRLFFGLPNWWCKYRYDLVEDGDNAQIYETAKSFSQFHYIDSMTDIIENKVNASRDELFTNCISLYTLGSSVKTSPTIYSDRTIYNYYQKTKMIDTTVVQDYFGPDFIYEIFHIDVGKDAAIRVAISNLIDSWNRNYSGEFLILGDPTVKPCDYIYINDLYVNMYGLCGVREVVHTMSWSTGFTTAITPDCIALNTQKNSGLGNIYKSLLSFGASYSVVKNNRYAVLQSSYLYEKLIGQNRTMANFLTSGYGEVLQDVLSLTSGYVTKKLMGGYIIGLISNGKLLNNIVSVVTNLGKIGTAATEAFKAAENVGKIAKIGQFIKGAYQGTKAVKDTVTTASAAVGTFIGGPIGGIILTIVVTIVIDIMLQAVVDEFSYNNCIKVIPLIYHNSMFISGTSGQTQLLLGINGDVSVDDVDSSSSSNQSYIASQYENNVDDSETFED